MAAGARSSSIEWPTLALVVLSYGVWLIACIGLVPIWLSVPLLILAITLHSSLQHEVVHGHPLPSRAASVALVLPPIGLFIPYERFRDTHLAHHRDARLTDPYDDPESFYRDPEGFQRLSAPCRALLQLNNTLAGRMLVGPAIGLCEYWVSDFRLTLRGDRQIALSWLQHMVLVSGVLWFVVFVGYPVWTYLLSAYGAQSVLRIRTFAEHQAHEQASGRSVIIEDRGLLALLFLNNNYHAVHHAHPAVPWYDLPALFRSRRDHYLARNRGYHFPGYGAVFRRYLLSAKEPVPHPQWHKK